MASASTSLELEADGVVTVREPPGLNGLSGRSGSATVLRAIVALGPRNSCQVLEFAGRSTLRLERLYTVFAAATLNL